MKSQWTLSVLKQYNTQQACILRMSPSSHYMNSVLHDVLHHQIHKVTFVVRSSLDRSTESKIWHTATKAKAMVFLQQYCDDKSFGLRENT